MKFTEDLKENICIIYTLFKAMDSIEEIIEATFAYHDKMSELTWAKQNLML